MVAIAVLGGLAACTIDSGHNNCGNQGLTGQGGDGGAGGQGGAGGSGGFDPFKDGGVPLSATIPIDCGGFAMTAPPPFTGVRVNLSMPSGSYLRWITVDVITIAGHAALPETMPIVKFASGPHVAPDTLTVISSGSDKSPTVGAYEAPHKITVDVAPTGPGFAIDNDSTVYAAISDGEKGAGSLGGTVFLGWLCFVRLGNCIDPTDGATKPDGSPCGMGGKCAAGKCNGG